MKGYIYITGSGVDPAMLHNFTDPTFGDPPTLGPCMPNIRRTVIRGDWIFVVSGRVRGVGQYLIGGLRVEEKIHALVAYRRLPENRLTLGEDGSVTGNIIVQEDGTHHPLDWHSSERFEARANNFIIGDAAITLSTPEEVELGRRETLPVLANVLHRRNATRVIDVMGRMSRLDEAQVAKILIWLRELKLGSGSSWRERTFDPVDAEKDP